MSKIVVLLVITIEELNVVPFIITPSVPPADAETVPVNEIEKVSKFNCDLLSHLIVYGATPPLIEPSILIVGPPEGTTEELQSWTPVKLAAATRSPRDSVVIVTVILIGGLQFDSSVTSTV